MRPDRVAQRNAQDLLVFALLVGHAEQTDRADLDSASGERRLAHEHQGIERVAVASQRAVDESVVGRIMNRAVEHTVEAKQSRLFVELVLVGAGLRDFDNDGKRRLNQRVVDVAVVPRMHVSK
mgnify:CR=1 FL=1